MPRLGLGEVGREYVYRGHSQAVAGLASTKSRACHGHRGGRSRDLLEQPESVGRLLSLKMKDRSKSWS